MKIKTDSLDSIKACEAVVQSVLNDGGVPALANQLHAIWANYTELATTVTDGQYDPSWSHENLMSFVKSFEF